MFVCNLLPGSKEDRTANEESHCVISRRHGFGKRDWLCAEKGMHKYKTLLLISC